MNKRAYLEGYLTKQADNEAPRTAQENRTDGAAMQAQIDAAKKLKPGTEGSGWASETESPFPPAAQAAPVTAAPVTKLPVAK
jgi:hypothetical protein